MKSAPVLFRAGTVMLRPQMFVIAKNSPRRSLAKQEQQGRENIIIIASLKDCEEDIDEFSCIVWDFNLTKFILSN